MQKPQKPRLQSKYGIFIVLSACSNSASYHFGKSIQDRLERNAHLQWMLCDEEIQCHLISMYGSCWKLERAQFIFDEIKHSEPKKYESNIAVWNTLIHAYGRNGKVGKSKELFDIMPLRADTQTYILLLNAFSHSGDQW